MPVEVHVAVILGGGAGSRLYPLTKSRAKPAVSIGGAYRLVDIPISNCINSGVNKIYVLTQYNSTSLNRHIGRTYNRGVTFAGKRNAGGIRPDLTYRQVVDRVRGGIGGHAVAHESAGVVPGNC